MISVDAETHKFSWTEEHDKLFAKIDAEYKRIKSGGSTDHEQKEGEDDPDSDE